MTIELLERLGFKHNPICLVALNYNLDLGRGRSLSVMDPGTGNERVSLCEADQDNQKIQSDVVTLHNYDYDGTMTDETFRNLVRILKIVCWNKKSTQYSESTASNSTETDKKIKLYNLAIELWGRTSQTNIVIEETAELTQALCKLQRTKDIEQYYKAVEHAREEIADVKIATEQIENILNNTGPSDKQVSYFYTSKFNRFKERLKQSAEKSSMKIDMSIFD